MLITRLMTALVFLLALAVRAEDLKPFGVKDLVHLSRISDVAASPEGNFVAYALHTADMDANKMLSSLWLLDAAKPGATPQRLTEDSETEAFPEWSSDGRYVYFLSSRGGSAQVWRVSPAGGKALQITNLPLEVASFRVSPQSDRIFVAMDVFRHCLVLACTVSELNAAAGTGHSGVLYDQLYVRHWDNWNDGRRRELFSINVDRHGIASAVPVKLTIDVDGDTPGRPFGGREDYTVSPDGQIVVFAQRNASAREPWTTTVELYQVLASGGERHPDGSPGKDADPRNLTVDSHTWAARPAFSPDGSKLAYLTTDRPGYESDRFHLVVRDFKSGEIRSLTQEWDRSIVSFAWAPDGKTLFATTDHLGQHPLWTIDARSGKATSLTTDGTVEAFSAGAHTVFYTHSTLASPADLFSIGFAGKPTTRLTDLNQTLLAQRKLGEYEQFTFTGWNGEAVRGYVVKPPNLNPAKRYPVALLIHDGPHGSLANGWNWRWNAQSIAGAGFGVVMIDFHGSTGYGQAFVDSIKGDLAGKAIDDLTTGVDAALKQYPWLNGLRMCALGDSYGGYLVNSIAGQTPYRFRCLVSHAGWFDNRSLYYSTDELWSPEYETSGPEYENPAGYAKQNPVDGVKNWRAPILFSHGQLDYRIPYTQSLAAFTAAQRHGVPSQFLLYPDENHWISRPNNTVQWYETVLGWVKAYTRN